MGFCVTQGSQSVGRGGDHPTRPGSLQAAREMGQALRQMHPVSLGLPRQDSIGADQQEQASPSSEMAQADGLH